MRQLRITILISRLRGGGAERLAALLANGLLARGHDVSVVTLAGPEEPFYPLDSGVALVPLGVLGESHGAAEAVLANARRIRAIRRALRFLAPEVLIASVTETNVLAVLAARAVERAPSRIVVWEHIYPPRQRIGVPWRMARRVTYPLADAVVPCGLGVAEWFYTWLPAHKVVPIQNPVSLAGRRPDAHAERLASPMASEKWILGMGRLAPEKGFDLLLEAFALVPAETRKGWRLGIVGEGPLRAELEHRVASLKLENQVELLGLLADPMPILRAGRIFALSSRHDAFPTALLEAMGCGLPAVAFDCPSGPGEIVRHGVDGLLVPPENVHALADALGRLMSDDALRVKLASRAPQVLQRFSEERFLRAWEALIGRLCG
jgi:glycosyltransferase involved in cell wall biosynthesis